MSEINSVDVWVAHFPTRAAFDAYVQELEREEEEDPLSEFISDQCQETYNRELFACFHQEETTTNVATLLQNAAADSGAYADTAAASYRKMKPGPVNAFFRMFGADVKKPRTVIRREYQVHYLGRFKYAVSEE